MKPSLLLITGLIFFTGSFAQPSRSLQNLHDYLLTNKPRGLDTTLNYVNYLPNGNINYLYPLFQLFREENKFK